VTGNPEAIPKVRFADNLGAIVQIIVRPSSVSSKLAKVREVDLFRIDYLN
jgi:hypothetical protein